MAKSATRKSRGKGKSARSRTAGHKAPKRSGRKRAPGPPASQPRRRKYQVKRPSQRRTGVAAEPREPSVGWLRRQRGAVWIDPEPHGKALFVRDGSGDDCEADEAVRFRIAQPKTHIHAALATVVERLGSGGSDATQLKMAVANLGLPMDFPTDVMTQADGFGEVEPDKALAADDRRDLRDCINVTIDGEDARDFDDAVSAEKEGERYRVWISIADVASYAKARSALDREARVRGTSVYLATQVLPMFPERLSNGLCSLVPGEPRLTLTCEMLVDKNGNRRVVGVYPALIRSAARLTYTQVQRFIDGDQAAVPKETAQVVQQAIAASRLLRGRRFHRGSLDLDIAEARVVINDDGEPTDIVPRTSHEAHHVIEDLMIAANESVAEYLLKQGLAGVYRVHPPPPPEKWELLEGWANSFGFRLQAKDRDNPKSLARFVRGLKQAPQAEAGQLLLLRTLSQAYYSAQVSLHFGLASEAYAHFTSPIRRYPDLLVHRALWNHWQGRSVLRGLDAAAQRCSETERRAVSAEREIDHLAACLLACKRVGEVFAARVVGVHTAGLFVRPDDFFAEGLVPMESLGRGGGEYFEVWSETQTIVGRSTGVRWTLGDELKVKMVRVDLPNRRINYELAERPAPSKRRESEKPAKDKDRGKRKGSGGRGNVGRRKAKKEKSPGRGRGGGRAKKRR